MSIQITKIEQLPKDSISLLHMARDVAKNAYNIYSNFYVGAAVYCSSGKTYVGTFMENASSGLTVCAEPSALMAANNAGDFVIEKLAVVGGKSLMSGGKIVTPCGRCRQMIFEASQVSGNDIKILCANGNLSSICVTTISELLPMPFGPEDLGFNDKLNKFRLLQANPQKKEEL